MISRLRTQWFQVPVFVDRWPSVSIKHKKFAVLEIQRTDSATVR